MGTWRPPGGSSALERTPTVPLASDLKDQAQFNGRPPLESLRPVGPGAAVNGRPDVTHSGDPRWSRPDSSHVRPAGPTRPPTVYTYRGWYTSYWCHPWYRWQYGTSAMVWFGWGVYPWYDTWIPPYRFGWSWMPGYWTAGYWYPGYWSPVTGPPMGYAYVPGWWESGSYVEGYYRSDDRDGWEWVDGWYTADGDYVRGHWRPLGDGPEGYDWEPGFWDGRDYHDGFWRPVFLDGYTWVSAYYDEDGMYRAGYWMPLHENPGHQWIPGWFDGNEWIPGYWVTDQEADGEDVQGWTPPEGARDGWDEPRKAPPAGAEKPPAVPVTIPREGQAP